MTIRAISIKKVSVSMFFFMRKRVASLCSNTTCNGLINDIDHWLNDIKLFIQESCVRSNSLFVCGINSTGRVPSLQVGS